jgi:hypothetical protein
VLALAGEDGEAFGRLTGFGRRELVEGRLAHLFDLVEQAASGGVEGHHGTSWAW